MTTLQTLLMLIAIISAVIIFSEIVMWTPDRTGLSGRTIWKLILLFVLCIIVFPVAACDEDDLTDYSTNHLLVVCTPAEGGYIQNSYYTGDVKCGLSAGRE